MKHTDEQLELLKFKRNLKDSLNKEADDAGKHKKYLYGQRTPKEPQAEFTIDEKYSYWAGYQKACLDILQRI